MTIKRTIIIDVTVEIACCRDGVEAYIPLPQDFHKTLISTKEYFPESLTVWRDRIIQKYEDYLWNMADVECTQVGTRKLCKFISDWSRTTTEEIFLPTKRIITAVETLPTKRKITARRIPKEEKEIISVPADIITSIERLESMKKRLPPKMITDQIEYLEEQKYIETNKQTKDKIQKEINSMKERYPAMSEETKEQIQKEIDDLKKKYGMD